MRSPKVLVGTPTSRIKDYAMPDYAKTIRGLTYTNFDVLMSDNSVDKNYHRSIYRNYGIECGWVQPLTKHTFEGLTISQNQLRARCIYGGYDFLLMLEVDITPPPCIIELLLAHRKQVVSAAYYIGLGAESQIAMMDLEETENPVNRLIPFEESYLKCNGKLITTKGAGIGCCLISRGVLEQIDFGISRSKAHIPSDTYFYCDLQMRGIKNYLDTSIICKHNNQQWKITQNSN